MGVAVRHIGARHRTFHWTGPAGRSPGVECNAADQMAVRPVIDRLTGRCADWRLTDG